jgi:hypothetical protein
MFTATRQHDASAGPKTSHCQEKNVHWMLELQSLEGEV